LSTEIVTRGEGSRISSVPARIYEEEMVTPILTNKFEEILEMEEISPRSRFSIDKFGFNDWFEFILFLMLRIRVVENFQNIK
jgi:hypothetical protein